MIIISIKLIYFGNKNIFYFLKSFELDKKISAMRTKKIRLASVVLYWFHLTTQCSRKQRRKDGVKRARWCRATSDTRGEDLSWERKTKKVGPILVQVISARLASCSLILSLQSLTTPRCYVLTWLHSDGDRCLDFWFFLLFFFCNFNWAVPPARLGENFGSDMAVTPGCHLTRSWRGRQTPRAQTRKASQGWPKGRF